MYIVVHIFTDDSSWVTMVRILRTDRYYILSTIQTYMYCTCIPSDGVNNHRPSHQGYLYKQQIGKKTVFIISKNNIYLPYSKHIMLPRCINRVYSFY